MKIVANMAGVSLSTVSRVINERPRVARSTVDSVRRAMAEIQFTPALRRPYTRVRSKPAATQTTIGYLEMGTSGNSTSPGFEKLLRGVSTASGEHQCTMLFNFISDLDQLPSVLSQQHFDGVLLHGEKPGAAIQAKLRNVPTVWLMANRERPTWGDQVMPDNAIVGEIAADYLVGRGHKNLAYLNGASGVWALEVRGLSFRQMARQLGAEATLVERALGHGQDFWKDAGVQESTQHLMETIVKMNPRPTGVFVAEDRLLPLVDAALRRHGINYGPGGQMELISCNNERVHLTGLSAPVATIDIRVESIGRRAVEQVLWRLRHPQVSERVRTLIEPLLVPAEGQAGI